MPCMRKEQVFDFTTTCYFNGKYTHNIKYFRFVKIFTLCNRRKSWYIQVSLMVVLYWLVDVILFNATFKDIYVILWLSVLLMEEVGISGENNRLKVLLFLQQRLYIQWNLSKPNSSRFIFVYGIDRCSIYASFLCSTTISYTWTVYKVKFIRNFVVLRVRYRKVHIDICIDSFKNLLFFFLSFFRKKNQ